MARRALKKIMEKRLEQEMPSIGVKPCEHAACRADYRNGHYVRHLLTEMGDSELSVPRSRKGGFRTRLLRRYARRQRSIDQVMLACFCLGLSTRKATSVLAPILGEGVSASTIFRIARELDHEVKAFHGRALQDHPGQDTLLIQVQKSLQRWPWGKRPKGTGGLPFEWSFDEALDAATH